MRSDHDLGAETVGIEPVDADQQVELIGQAFDRFDGQAEQGGLLAAAVLGTHGSGENPQQAGGTGRFEQEIASGQRAGAAAAHGDRDTGEAPMANPGLEPARRAALNMYLSTRMRFFAFP